MRVDWLSEVENKFDHPAVVLWRAIELKHIEEVLNKRNLTEPILDLGCAEGKIAGLLLKGKKLIGLDNSWELLGQNKKNEVYQELILADACYMPFKNGFFSSVFSNCVVEHIPDIKAVLQEVYRVLKPKGIFLFTVPSDKFGDYLFFSAIFNNLGLRSISNWYKKKRNSLLNHFHCYSHNRWGELLDKGSFDLIEYNYYMPKKAAIFWDFLAFLILILRSARLLNLVQPKLNKYLRNYLKRYYSMESGTGAGLLIVAQKRSI